MALIPVQERTSDEELMGRVQGTDDAEAFARLYDRHAARAYRVARSVCGDTHRSQDAVQEGFLSIWRARDRFCPEQGCFGAWSMTVVRRAAIDILRGESAEKRPPPGKSSEETIVSGSASAEEEVMMRDTADALRGSLAQLPDLQAEVISLAFFGELTHREIAAELALPEGTVKGRIRLGLERLRHSIRDGH